MSATVPRATVLRSDEPPLRKLPVLRTSATIACLAGLVVTLFARRPGASRDPRSRQSSRPGPRVRVGCRRSRARHAEAFRRLRVTLDAGERFALVFPQDTDRDQRGFYDLVSLSYLYPALASSDPAGAGPPSWSSACRRRTFVERSTRSASSTVSRSLDVGHERLPAAARADRRIRGCGCRRRRPRRDPDSPSVATDSVAGLSPAVGIAFSGLVSTLGAMIGIDVRLATAAFLTLAMLVVARLLLRSRPALRGSSGRRAQRVLLAASSSSHCCSAWPCCRYGSCGLQLQSELGPVERLAMCGPKDHALLRRGGRLGGAVFRDACVA